MQRVRSIRDDSEYSNQSMFNWGAWLAGNLSSGTDCVLVCPLLQGYVGQREIAFDDGGDFSRFIVTLIARRSRRRAGTRYNSRGLDDEGNVANFVESEIICHSFDYDESKKDCELLYSHVQVRGSVPIFWSQRVGFSPEITRRKAMTLPAFFRHKHQLYKSLSNSISSNDSSIVLVDLLSRSKEAEARLGDSFRGILTDTSCPYFSFDFNDLVGESLSEGLQPLLRRLNGFLDDFGVFSMNSQQTGLIRTNCLDCLDRTNAVQLLIAWHVFLNQIRGHMNKLSSTRTNTAISTSDTGIPAAFLALWVEQGDAISKIYTGSGSVLSRFIRSSGSDKLGAFIEQTWRGAERLYSHAVEGGDRQAALEAIAGDGDGRELAGGAQSMPSIPIGGISADLSATPCDDGVPLSLTPPSPPLSVWVCSWNVGGARAWESDELAGILRPCDLVVVGVQELVPLDLSSLLFPGRRSEDRGIELEKQIISTLDDLTDSGSYVIVETVTMVGLWLLVAARSEIVYDISKLWTRSVKAGVGGAGNKGAVGLGFSVGGWEFGSNPCEFSFINIHLDSGVGRQTERATQLNSILDEFKEIEKSDNSIIFGDFNFRVCGFETEDIFKFLDSGRTLQLIACDEFISGISSISQFFRKNYKEGPLTFPPTYKFDKSSYNVERAPAWCDRIFVRGGDLKSYAACLGCLASDHKPVVAKINYNNVRLGAGALAGWAREPNWGSRIDGEWLILGRGGAHCDGAFQDASRDSKSSNQPILDLLS